MSAAAAVAAPATPAPAAAVTPGTTETPAGTEPVKPAETPATPVVSEPEKESLRAIAKASKQAREALEARDAALEEVKRVKAEGGTASERAKAADEYESALKDARRAVRLLEKNGLDFPTIVKAWQDPEADETPAQKEQRERLDRMEAAEKTRKEAEEKAAKDAMTKAQRAEYDAGLQRAKDLLTGAKDGKPGTLEGYDAKRWKLAASDAHAGQVVESVLAGIQEHLTANKLQLEEAEIEAMFFDGLDQAEKHLRSQAKADAELLAALEGATPAAQAAAVEAAAAVTPKGTRTIGARRDGEPAPTASRTIDDSVRGSLPRTEAVPAPMSGGKRRVGIPTQGLG